MEASHKRTRGSIFGVLVVDKPVGMTSMDVVAIVRGRADGARTGHAGTLDPLADGVLVLGLGRATKALGRFMDTTKVYRTEIDLSAFTNTDDLEGNRVEVEVAEPPDEARVRSVLATFRGRIMQRPPQRSAVKVGGRRAYAMARRGEAVELEPRPVDVYELELVSYAWPLLEIAVTSGKGMYVRSLARDIGGALGTGGHCRRLRRTAVGPFTEDEAQVLDRGPLEQSDLIPLDEALARVDSFGPGTYADSG
jgi:tRNA pseudouridine55 synthase